MCCGAEAGSYLRLVDCCTTQRKAQGPFRTCNESKEEDEEASTGMRFTIPGPFGKKLSWKGAYTKVSGMDRGLFAWIAAYLIGACVHAPARPRAVPAAFWGGDELG